ncbi:hypothetical protein FQR65_LT04357 [Abscondita terminalis]|nr:hypothetical protein FQR65_LT04357 [Abscondita terminalis]
MSLAATPPYLKSAISKHEDMLEAPISASEGVVVRHAIVWLLALQSVYRQQPSPPRVPPPPPPTPSPPPTIKYQIIFMFKN